MTPANPLRVAIVTGAARGIGAAISFLASEGARHVSGQVIYVAGGPLC
jgi:NAD(P)-dependent dehydrogenase (short-subunit alcohol dehydrogenase family)